jgi:hypothetical protein
MATFLFWNLNRRPLLPLIRALVEEHRVDVLVLAESQLLPEVLVEGLNAQTDQAFSYPMNLSEDLQILIRYPVSAMEPLRDDRGMALRWFRPTANLDMLLALIHFPSKQFLTESDQSLLAMRYIQRIEEAEENLGHRRTIVLGDLNMNPFEPGMIGSEGFHAVSTRMLAGRTSRIVQGVPRHFFYNPMWSLFGDRSPGPPGTYFFSSSSPTAIFWHMFDQVLIRPELLERTSNYNVHILTGAGHTSLLSSNGTPNRVVGSDHLPLLFQIALEGEVRP